MTLNKSKALQILNYIIFSSLIILILTLSKILFFNFYEKHPNIERIITLLVIVVVLIFIINMFI